MASNKNYMLNDKFPKQIKNATSTSDGLMSAEDKAKFDELFEFGRLSPVTELKDGIMTSEDKVKLDGIEQGANNYIHPDSHNATMIVEDVNHRFITDEQISLWNSKASTDIVTTARNGLMPATDKAKLDTIEEGANKYIHPNTSSTRHVTDEQIALWTSKASTDLATQTKSGLMSATDKIKLDGIEQGANKYIHPDTSTMRHVSDEQISLWNSKASTDLATQTKSGLMSAEDKVKLDSIASGSNSYTHPDTHPATMIVEDSTHRFITDDERVALNQVIAEVAEIQQRMLNAVYYE